MNNFVLELWDDEGSECTFYTVRFEEATISETDRFLSYFEKLPEYEKALGELLSFVIDAVGNEHGAVDELFNREENEVTGLPAKGHVQLGTFSYFYPRFPLRLYALKITEHLVVLFNGGVKNGPTNQASDLNFKWVEACLFAKKITDAIREGIVVVDETERRLYLYNGSEEIIL